MKRRHSGSDGLKSEIDQDLSQVKAPSGMRSFGSVVSRTSLRISAAGSDAREAPQVVPSWGDNTPSSLFEGMVGRTGERCIGRTSRSCVMRQWIVISGWWIEKGKGDRGF